MAESNGQDWKDLTPKLHELRFLAAKRGELKKQAASNGKKILVKGLVDPVPCVICGVVYDRYNHGKDKFENCAGCRAKLASGDTVLICKVNAQGLVDGRYLWLESNLSPNSAIVKGMAGKVIGVMPATMDLMIARKEGKAIKVVCPNCNDEMFAVRDTEVDPDGAVMARCLCSKCRGDTPLTEIGVTYFDKDGDEIK
jgi:hypothetical protein